MPVIRNVDQLSLLGIAAELRSIAERIRTNRFEVDDLRGGTFTVTNYGALGSIFGTPIINYPEVAILGVGRMRELVVMRGRRAAARLDVAAEPLLRPPGNRRGHGCPLHQRTDELLADTGTVPATLGSCGPSMDGWHGRASLGRGCSCG